MCFGGTVTSPVILNSQHGLNLDHKDLGLIKRFEPSTGNLTCRGFNLIYFYHYGPVQRSCPHGSHTSIHVRHKARTKSCGSTALHACVFYLCSHHKTYASTWVPVYGYPS
ncbi:hypothetical protein OPQ81_011842 [Rhizoctonia solani]|nr:hypothetical protein OPQ81_011842 [Rhizoctonia solani]